MLCTPFGAPKSAWLPLPHHQAWYMGVEEDGMGTSLACHHGTRGFCMAVAGGGPGISIGLPNRGGGGERQMHLGMVPV